MTGLLSPGEGFQEEQLYSGFETFTLFRLGENLDGAEVLSMVMMPQPKSQVRGVLTQIICAEQQTQHFALAVTVVDGATLGHKGSQLGRSVDS